MPPAITLVSACVAFPKEKQPANRDQNHLQSASWLHLHQLQKPRQATIAPPAWASLHIRWSSVHWTAENSAQDPKPSYIGESLEMMALFKCQHPSSLQRNYISLSWVRVWVIGFLKNRWTQEPLLWRSKWDWTYAKRFGTCKSQIKGRIATFYFYETDPHKVLKVFEGLS